ncbi:MAG: hypothetical protein ABSH09_14420 [Bryobacteraceae bacterium]|jgi:hypothetical protein
MIQVIMRTLTPTAVIALSFLTPAMIFAQSAPSVAPSVNTAGLTVADVTVGQNLEAVSKISLNRPVPAEGLEVTVKSENPSLLLLSTDASTAGSEAIVFKLRPGFNATPEFYVQALGKSGTATYAATAPGLGSATGTAKLAPSGIIIAGPAGFGLAGFQSSIRGAKVHLKIYSALLDSALNFVAFQAVAGGSPVSFSIASSNPAVGVAPAEGLELRPGTSTVTTLFKPTALGETTLALNGPANFSVPAKFASLVATVALPTFAIPNGIMIGKDLEAGAAVGLGQAAPPEGVEVTLASADPSKLLIARSGLEKGSGSLVVKVPAGAFGVSIFLQALDNSGKVSYTASAPGYQARSADVLLEQSGFVIAGPLSFPHSGFKREPGFYTSLAGHMKTAITVYSAYLDPETHRTADVTVQPLRAGISVTTTITNSMPEIGSMSETKIVVEGATDAGKSEFTPLSAGQTILSLVTPDGFSTSANSTYLRVTVTP